MKSSALILFAWLGRSAICQESVFIQTDAATTQTYSGGGVVVSGTTMTFKDTTLTVVATTSSQSPETITRTADTRTYDALSTVLASIQNMAAVDDIENFASSLTNLASIQVATAVADLEAYYTSLQPDTPYIIYQAPKDVMNQFVNDELDEKTYVSVYEAMMDPWNASRTSEVAALLTGMPSLSSEVLDYMSVAKTFMASSLSVVGSIVSKDLSLTGAGPTGISAVSESTATTTTGSPSTGAVSQGTATTTPTSSSSAGAAETIAPIALLNAAAVAAGMAVLALL